MTSGSLQQSQLHVTTRYNRGIHITQSLTQSVCMRCWPYVIVGVGAPVYSLTVECVQ